MVKPLSRAARIRALLAKGKLGPRQIAAEIGCHEGYVQAVKQRIIHGGMRPADKAWVKANPDKMRSIWRENGRAKALRKKQEQEAPAQ